MRAARSLAVLLALLAPAAARAQNPGCAGYAPTTRRVCDAAVDGTRGLHPVAGLLVSGGNPVLGSANSLGGLGHFAITVRANAVDVVLPDVGYDGSGSSVPSSEELFAPAPVVEAAAGIYGGMPSGLLAVDLLASAQLLPTNQIDNLVVDQGARRIGDVALGLGYGVRVGLLRENLALPAVSVSLMRRDIPEVAYGSLSAGDQYRYAVDLRATNLRLVASKQLALFGLAGGLGWDKYTGDAVIQFRDQGSAGVEPAIPVELSSSRTLAFVNAGVALSAVSLVGEAGYQFGKDEELTTDFDDFDDTKGKFFAGLGLQLSF